MSIGSSGACPASLFGSSFVAYFSSPVFDEYLEEDDLEDDLPAEELFLELDDEVGVEDDDLLEEWLLKSSVNNH